MGYGTSSKFAPSSDDALSLNAATTGIGTVKPLNDCRQIVWDVEGAGTIAGGTLKIESNANSPSYSGTWNELDSIDLTTLSGGKAYHNTYPGMLAFVRARLSINVTGGGSVTVRINGLLG